MLKFFNIEFSFIFTASMLLSFIIICFGHSFHEFKKRNDTKAIQASHVKPAPRIGGLSIMIALVLVAMPFLQITNSWLNYSLLLLSAFPVFLVGIFEDLGYFSSPRVRLLAAVFSSALFVFLFEQWLPRTDIPGLDLAIQWAPIGIAFSIFLATGVSHAFNLIDGLNGLAGFIAAGVGLSLAVISYQFELYEHLNVLFILISAISGFLVLNFPLGKIFLGDGGAYFIGHILVWMAISILCEAPNISPLAMLLIFFFPVADTLLAIVRRLYLGRYISHPDRLHFHQLIMRGIEIVLLGRKRRHISNPLATAFMLPLAFTPMFVGVLLALDRSKAMIALLLFTTLFLSTYKICIWLILQSKSLVKKSRFEKQASVDEIS